MVASLNEALDLWPLRVPFLYSLTLSTAREYSLPDYVIEPLDVEFKDSTSDYWKGIPFYETSLTTAGVLVLNLAYTPHAGQSGRVVWWAQNSLAPIEQTLLSAGIITTDTALSLSGEPPIAKAGYVKVNNEWMQYAGVSQADGITTLQNLVRAVNNTQAAQHDQGDEALWGVAAHRSEYFIQLTWGCVAYLCELKAQGGASRQYERYFEQARYFRQMADEMSAKIPAWRPPKMRLGLSLAPRSVYSGLPWLNRRTP